MHSPSKLLSLTLLIAFLSLSLTTADASQHAGVMRSRHRMVKIQRRQGTGLGGALLGGGEGVANPGAAPTDSTTASGAASTTPAGSVASTGTASGVASTTQPAGAATTRPPSVGDPLGSIINGLDPSNSASLSSSSSSSSVSSSSSSSSSIRSTTTPPPSSTASSTASLSTSSSGSFVTVVTITQPLAPLPSNTTSSDDNSDDSPGVSPIGKKTIIILVAIGASIGAAGIIWTIIRKWKFRPSSSFEDRMQPIDWQPTTDGPAPGHARAAGSRDMTQASPLERNASTRSHGSFTSGQGHNESSLIADLPPQDYLGHGQSAVGGYADLHRGPSPLPPAEYAYGVHPSQYAAPQMGQQQQGYYGGAQGYQQGYEQTRY